MLPRNRALLSRKYKFGEAKSCADGQCVVQIIHEVIYVKLMEEHSKKKKHASVGYIIDSLSRMRVTDQR